ncbi:MAG: AIR synthase family protein [Chloroflexota bacterium]|nr:AIR synthase family protein [Chloroflexota bacterium]
MKAKDVFSTGKLPLDLLNKLLQRYTRPDDRLIAGPSVGEDVAAIDMGDRYIVVKTDPITFASDQIGWYAVHVNANDVATSGACPRWMLNTILLPDDQTTPKLVETIFAQLHQACEALDITLVGGHTEVTWGLNRPIVVGVLIGEVPREELITTAGAQEGDHILLAKGIPIEATALIARERADELRRRGYEEEFLERAKNYLYEPGISVVDAARIAAKHPGVHAMHDPTEGGLATGLHELALAAGTGLVLYADDVPVTREGKRLCEEYGLDPLGTIASGALIITVAPEEKAALMETYQKAHIPCACIGRILPAKDGVCMIRSGERLPLPRFEQDEIARIF